MVGYSHTIENTLRNLSKETKIDSFVETGTFQGKTIEIASKIFSNNCTIELNNDLYLKAEIKFRNKNIKCFLGHSPVILKRLIKNFKVNSIFFLDAHWAGELSSRYNEDTPLLEELEIIFSRVGKFEDVIIIDDVSFMNKKGKYIFTKEMKSQYFPNGGKFEWDWTNVDKKAILKKFSGCKKVIEQEDRLIIYT